MAVDCSALAGVLDPGVDLAAFASGLAGAFEAALAGAALSSVGLGGAASTSVGLADADLAATGLADMALTLVCLAEVFGAAEIEAAEFSAGFGGSLLAAACGGVFLAVGLLVAVVLLAALPVVAFLAGAFLAGALRAGLLAGACVVLGAAVPLALAFIASASCESSRDES